ncbi:type VI secretion system tip protein TssI/VgrG [Bacterioplanoides pacificum]|uniref:Type VI secretion system tip protein TssI/VgrG n=1 Tax=Bacterioplanoides pacificum TaxID=1171596 RepID=A0ABV7VQA1_9GAMM
MPYPEFRFTTPDYRSEFELISFSGEEAISSLFWFSLELKVPLDARVDLEVLSDSEAKLTVLADKDSGRPADYSISGVIESAEEVLSTSATHRFYRVEMVPALARQKHSLSYDIYTHMTADKVLEEELREDIQLDYLLATTSSYPKKDFFCQYAESNFSFVSRLSEHWGIYYYFNHDANTQLVFADDTNYDEIITRKVKLDELTRPTISFDSIRTLRKIVNSTVDGVVISDVNPELASTHIEGIAGKTDGKKGCVHLVSQGVDNKDEANQIATIRLEELQCRGVTYLGTSGIPNLAPGFILKVESGDSKTTELLVLEVSHSGSGLDNTARNSDTGAAPFYECSFTAIPRSVQFRPRRETEIPTAVSTTARVYSADNKKNIAQRDERGRYQVVFDFLPREAGKSSSQEKNHVSHWIRMAQSAALSNHSDMPLVPGTEVKIGFTSGNPDRPYIIGALENSQSLRYPVTNENPHHATLITDGMLYTETAKARKSLHISSQFEYDKVQQQPFDELDFDGKTAGNQVDEIKGDQHIYRRYGDLYSFIDSNNYYYGRECSFHFGQHYTEYHANWQAVGEANNRFDIHDDMLYSADQPVSDRKTADSAKNHGLVTKEFGHKYHYMAGTSTVWAQGPDMQGIHKEFHYGGRYRERLVSFGDDRIDNFKGFAVQPDDNSLIDKTRGNTFFWQQGDHVSATEGKIITEQQGDRQHTFKGNETTKTEGDLTLQRKGKQTIEEQGDVSHTLTGDRSITHKGNATLETSGDISSKTQGNVTTQISGKLDAKVASPTNLTLQAPTSVKQTGALNIQTDTLELKATSAVVKADMMQQQSSMSTVKSKMLKVESQMISADAKMVTMKGQLVMIG